VLHNKEFDGLSLSWEQAFWICRWKDERGAAFLAPTEYGWVGHFLHEVTPPCGMSSALQKTALCVSESQMAKLINLVIFIIII
jgi:hypothetical protein